MLALSFVLNIFVLIPALAGLLRGSPAMDTAFGGASDARAILACVYATILLFSLVGLIALAFGFGAPVLFLGVGLLGFQVVYKLFSLVPLGLAHPVGRVNLSVAAFRCATLLSLWVGASG